jgi:hypothetical protein
MAHDLIFGKLARDWSCGAVLSLADVKDPKALEYDLFATRDAKRIGSLAKEEIQKNFATIVKLDTAKRLPVAVRKEFGAFMRKWVDFNYARNSKYAERDFVALMNFREANKRFTERLAIFDQLAKTPLKQPVSPTSLVPFGLPGSQAPTTPRPWGWLLGLGLGLAGLGFVAGKARSVL